MKTEKRNESLSLVAKFRQVLQDLNLQTANDESKLSVYYQTALADIGIEKYLASEISNILEDVKVESGAGSKSLNLAVLIVENLIISNQEQDLHDSELNQLYRELVSHMAETDPDSTTLLAIQATLERGKLYAIRYIHDVISIDKQNVDNLGERLNVSSQLVNEYNQSC